MILLPAREKIAKKNHYPKTLLTALDAFYRITSAAQWQTPIEVKKTFPSAMILKNGRIIFDIDDQYYLGVRINYQMQAMFILFFEPYGRLPEMLQNDW